MNTQPHNNPLAGKAIFDIFFSLLFPGEARVEIKRYHCLNDSTTGQRDQGDDPIKYVFIF